MILLDNLFALKKKEAIQPEKVAIPPMSEIIMHLYSKGLESFGDEVVRVLYSTDGTKRIVILHSNRGFYKVVHERIEVLSEEEWQYFCHDKSGYPAYWIPEKDSISLYVSVETAIQELQAQPENRIYFVSENEGAL